ncbi:MAG: 30S ribosomal protein S3 [Candidatus Omnitrophica bacterium]|nr:30S ribosomal protein S3 [Candidatus Omnitrophota bacterium]
MGQKVHPYGVRLGFVKDWKAKWYSRREYKELLFEDLQIRKKVKDMLRHSGIASIDIERSSGRVRLRIYSARPGIIIGRKGQEIDKLRTELAKVTSKDIYIDIKEVKNPLISAQLVAENVAHQLEKRVSTRKAMKKAISSCLSNGGDGIKIQCSGRLGGAEIARVEGYKEGKIPLNTFRANIDYAYAEARTTYGVIGIKVWIYVEKEIVEQEEEKPQDKGSKKNKRRQPVKDDKPEQSDKPEEQIDEGEVDNAVDAVQS